ncbi:hypothetical protein RZO55_04415 [Clostridium boliviensis]|uniref:Lipoprotein n=1 Tax=Clostridium boliviensis TaxID=318465 RepID=A0ABU4GGS9_9CLOT|nr:hypothetical protein [Clostridium boliviensis]MDW2796821.1 hypothetical protein [Clostridium boliviensis]
MEENQMKKVIAIFLTAFMVAGCLSGCRTTSRKQIRPLFFHVSAQIFIL